MEGQVRFVGLDLDLVRWPRCGLKIGEDWRGWLVEGRNDGEEKGEELWTNKNRW